ncbi:MAG: hypothetical protein KGL35_28050 [Bradyrhizobium sp.]|nr:hypothetical protein [Bradyrhizobium sp.]
MSPGQRAYIERRIAKKKEQALWQLRAAREGWAMADLEYLKRLEFEVAALEHKLQ